jgi:prolyl-tRNA synthetase
VRRDTGFKKPVPVAGIDAVVPKLLETIQNDMFARARDTYYSRLKEITRWEDVVPTLDSKCVAVIPWCEVEACEDDIKERSGRA